MRNAGLDRKQRETIGDSNRPSGRKHARSRIVLPGAAAAILFALVSTFLVGFTGWLAFDALLRRDGKTALVLGGIFAGLVVLLGLTARPWRRGWFSDFFSGEDGEAFRAAVAALPDAVLGIDQTLTIRFANRAAEELYGYAPGTLAGLDLGDLMAPAARSQDERTLREAFKHWSASSGVRSVERVAVRKDGGEFPIDIAARPYASPDGQMLVTVIRDVSQRQANDRALRRSRENLERAQRIASVGSFERDLVTGKVEWSGEFLRIWGVTSDPAQHSIEFVTSLVHPDDREKFTEVRQAVIALKTVPQPDFRIIRLDGTERVFHNEYSVELDEEGRPARLRGTVQDVTERKRIENVLRRSRERLTRAQHIAGIGSFDHDLVTDEVEWSDELYRLYGLSPEQGGGNINLVLPFVHPDDREKFLSIRTQAAQGIRNASLDFRILRPDGAEQILHRECDVTFDDAGKPVHMFGTVQDITLRKKIEVELRRSRESLARAQRLAAIGSFQRHLVTGEVEFSEELYRIHGVECGAPGATLEFLRALVHPEDRERVADFRRTVEAGTAMPPIDYRIIRPDGVERVLHRECDILVDEHGKAIYLFGTLQDITERKKIETELRRSQENLARAHRVAGIGSFERDLVTGRLEWSDEFLKIWGIDRRPSHGTAELLLSLVHPDDREKFMEGRDAALGRKPAPPHDFRIVRPDGEERTLHREYGVMFDNAGKPVRMFGTVQDITERKKAEIEIQRSRENLARAQKIAAMGSFERDYVTGKAEWSDEMYRMLGLDKTDTRPGPEVLMKLIHPEDRERFLAYRMAERHEQPIQPLEYRVIRLDGEERILRRESVVIFDDEKRAVRVYGTLQDITEQRLAERRERELERQLLHSHKLEALGTLAGGIAHDLNNTLVPIMALSKLTARRFEPGSVVRANLETIYEASERARDLVKRVVAFTRKDESEKRDTNIAETVEEALKLLRATVPSSISLKSQIDTVPPIPADASQIHQVITNLVTNAFQAIGNNIGTITVTLGVAPGDRSQPEIKLSIGDTGMGMDEATQQRIFEPFFTTKPVGQGTGLGLSIVHGIVAGHGGRIEIKSAPGKGTRFDLYFPVPAEGVARSSRPAA
jgi:PAS domain S-box-containing protein